MAGCCGCCDLTGINDDGKMVPLSLDYNKVMQTLTLWPDAALSLSMSTTLGLDWPVSIPSPGRCWGTARVGATGCLAPGTSTSLAPEEREPCLSTGCRVCIFCQLSSLFLGHVCCNLLHPLLQRNSSFFKVFICCSQEHQFVSQNSLPGKWLSFKVAFSSHCDAVGPFTPFVRQQALQQNWTHAFQSLTWYVISYFILLSVWGSLSGLVFFSIIAFNNWRLTAA